MTRGAQEQQPFAASPAENYERYFVPCIGGPIARDLVTAASIRGGERVLDVACGTGVATRLAAARVGPSGRVAGLDMNPGMLAVARSATPADAAIDWYEASAEAMPLPDVAFDVALCSMGLQFVGDKLAALREMRRVLASGGRAVIGAPGPTPAAFEVLADGLARHVAPRAASFVHAVFSLNDEGELRGLLAEAGFREIAIGAATKTLTLPGPAEFLWQYVYSTPLAAAVAELDEPRRAELQRDVCAGWRELGAAGPMTVPVRMITATASK